MGTEESDTKCHPEQSEGSRDSSLPLRYAQGFGSLAMTGRSVIVRFLALLQRSPPFTKGGESLIRLRWMSSSAL